MFKLALNAGHGLHTKGKQTPDENGISYTAYGERAFLQSQKPKYLQTTYKRARYKQWIMQY